MQDSLAIELLLLKIIKFCIYYIKIKNNFGTILIITISLKQFRTYKNIFFQNFFVFCVVYKKLLGVLNMKGSKYVHCINLSSIYITNCKHTELIFIFFDGLSKLVELFFSIVLQICFISNISKTNNGLDSDLFQRHQLRSLPTQRKERKEKSTMQNCTESLHISDSVC